MSTTGGSDLILFTARTGNGASINQVVPGFGFPVLAPGLVLTPSTSFLNGNQLCLNALTGAANDTSCGPTQVQYGPGKFAGGKGGSSGWINANFTFGASDAGSYKMVTNVANVGDEIYSSALFFAGGSIQGGTPVIPATIPEPSTLMLLGTGLMGGVLKFWKRLLS